jgi:hypothetical protein
MLSLFAHTTKPDHLGTRCRSKASVFDARTAVSSRIMASKLVGAMRNMRRTHDEDDRATNLGVAALGMLFLSNIALAILGLILVIVGSKSSGKHVSAVFAHGGLNDTLFEKPDVGASVLGVLLLALSAYGMFGLWHRNKTTLMIYHVWALFMLVRGRVRVFRHEYLQAINNGHGAQLYEHVSHQSQHHQDWAPLALGRTQL